MRHSWSISDSPDLPIRAFHKALGKNRPATLEGGKGGGPAAPNPWEVSAAQTATNRDTAVYNKALNLGNYSNPFGSQQSSFSGYDPVTGAPQYQTTTTANPALQEQLNNQLSQIGQANSINQSAIGGLYGLNSAYGGLGNQLGAIGAQVGGLGSQLSPDAAQNAQLMGRDASYQAQTQYLDPQFSQGQESLEAKLAAQGLAPGSQAYNNAMLNFQNQKQRAYSDAANQSILTGSQLGSQNLQNQLASLQTQSGLLGQQGAMLGQQGNFLGQQSDLLRQLTGLGQQSYGNLQTIASMIPGYTGIGQSATNPADIAAAMQNQYQGELGKYNARQQGTNATISSGLGAAGLLGAAFLLSDRRLKRDIKAIGDWNGTPVYSYRYVFDDKRYIGVMAQEAPAHAVANVCGVLMVDYTKL